ncbi:MAG: hypothetical protein UY04_C0007G0002 [Parcubacteria group bacterium GW2011_GWA2_47_7]|nr:MAG: hypothetical protein UY04_C0007G0002 [Parcubacteria group bacterium GW2011_GWA2_47_7]
MELFNKTFFRFAFGFIGIIMVSVGIIFALSPIPGDPAGGSIFSNIMSIFSAL